MSPDQTPGWFVEALESEAEHHTVEAAGATLAYRAWGEPSDPVVVLVHGGAAHAGWWDHVAPHLTAGHRVVALDLSGHGDSAWRDDYSLETYAAEVIAVAEAQGADRPVVIGHSMGGFVALATAREYGDRLSGACAIDSPVRQMSAETKEWRAKNHRPPATRVYATREEMVSRFRTIPDDGDLLPYVREHIARGSVREVEGGWTWKFDPATFFATQMEPEDLVAAVCPVALVRGERGLATNDITSTVAQRLGGHVPVTVVPDAGHHIMIDQPVALISAMQALLGEWSRPAS